MTVGDAGTVVITGPTGGLGKPTTLEMARRTGSGPTCSWCQNLTEELPAQLPPGARACRAWDGAPRPAIPKRAEAGAGGR